jgi:hypothetical protein
MKEYGIEELKFLANNWNKEKILKYLNFLTNEKHLLTWMKSAWSTKLNQDYVEQEIIMPFQR